MSRERGGGSQKVKVARIIPKVTRGGRKKKKGAA